MLFRSSIVTKVVTDIKQYGTVQRAMLGVSYIELTPQLAQEKGITAVNDGILVEDVVDRSAAMEAGIKVGDVIIAINGAKTHNRAQMLGEMSKYRPGDVVNVKFIRDNKEKVAKVTLRNTQGSTKMTKADDFTALGCAFKPLTKEQQRQYMVNAGVQVVGLKDGKFKEAGIKENFIILDINGSRIKSQDDVERIYDAIMKSNDPDKVMFLTGLYPTGKKVYYAVPLSE